nr:PREDICTED: deoxyribonuclease gamma isoform X1 [Lepisosteus oculatus]
MLLAMYLQVSLLFFIWTGALTLKICSFNIQSFGESKVAKPEILDVIGKCISRCDIALVMEIKDASGKVFPQLMTHLNSQLNRKKDQYKYVISERLGRKSYKEQYAFIFREKLVSLQAVYQYPDQQEEGEVEDSFAREPFISWFTSSRTAIKNFVIIPIHTAPEAAVREIDALYDVYMNTTQRWKIENIIIMGDFNADCGYVPKKKWRNIRLKSNSSFVWLINDESDTTVKESTHCAYDRIVLHGQNLVQAVDPKSVKIYDFKTAYGLTEKELYQPTTHNWQPTEAQQISRTSLHYDLVMPCGSMLHRLSPTGSSSQRSLPSGLQRHLRPRTVSPEQESKETSTEENELCLLLYWSTSCRVSPLAYHK